MCGLAFAISKKGNPAGQQIIKLYNKQDHRGKLGFGFLAIQNGVLIDVKRAKTESAIKHYLNTSRAELIMFHHRAPTSTDNTIGTTHPFLVQHDELKYDYYFAHNGVIGNADFIKKLHNTDGYVYKSEYKEITSAVHLDGTEEVLSSEASVYNDSESLAIELAKYIEGIIPRVRAIGASAFWGISLEKGTNKVVEVFYGKNMGRDLRTFDNKKWWGVASLTGTEVPSMELFSFNIDDKKKTLYTRPLKMDEAKPIVPVVVKKETVVIGFGRDDESSPNYDNLDTLAQELYDGLVNAFYTIRDIQDSGMPFSEFTKTVHDRVDCYIPAKFMGIDLQNRKWLREVLQEKNEAKLLNAYYTQHDILTLGLPFSLFIKSLLFKDDIYYPRKFHSEGANDRKFLSDVLNEADNSEPTEKELEQLTYYATQHAKAEIMMGKYDQLFDDKKISSFVHKNAIDSLTRRQDDILTNIALLNVDENTVDEYCEMALEYEKEDIEVDDKQIKLTDEDFIPIITS
jgi:predicted glutamine amidotransferase